MEKTLSYENDASLNEITMKTEDDGVYKIRFVKNISIVIPKNRKRVIIWHYIWSIVLAWSLLSLFSVVYLNNKSNHVSVYATSQNVFQSLAYIFGLLAPVVISLFGFLWYYRSYKNLKALEYIQLCYNEFDRQRYTESLKYIEKYMDITNDDEQETIGNIVYLHYVLNNQEQAQECLFNIYSKHRIISASNIIHIT